jgi:hypothetical protein
MNIIFKMWFLELLSAYSYSAALSAYVRDLLPTSLFHVAFALILWLMDVACLSFGSFFFFQGNMVTH